MGCCGQKRAALRTRVRTDPAPPHPPEIGFDGTSDVVEYQGNHPMLVYGPGGRSYTFSPGRRSAVVAASDVQELLRHPLFRLEERRPNGTPQKSA
jgi:hypothetical protein